MIKLTTEELKYINLFENMTRARVIDCILKGDDITFIVDEKQIGLALGKKGATVQKVKEKIGKEIHVYEYSRDLAQFIKNLLYPVHVEKVEIKGDEVLVYVRPEEKKRAIGRDGKKIKTVKEIVSRHFKIKEIKVV